MNLQYGKHYESVNMWDGELKCNIEMLVDLFSMTASVSNLVDLLVDDPSENLVGGFDSPRNNYLSCENHHFHKHNK